MPVNAVLRPQFLPTAVGTAKGSSTRINMSLSCVVAVCAERARQLDQNFSRVPAAIFFPIVALQLYPPHFMAPPHFVA
jgi:hypothetical protein